MEKSSRTAASSKIAHPNSSDTTETVGATTSTKQAIPLKKRKKERMTLQQIVTLVIVGLLVLSFMGSYFFMYGIPALMGIQV